MEPEKGEEVERCNEADEAEAELVDKPFSELVDNPFSNRFKFMFAVGLVVWVCIIGYCVTALYHHTVMKIHGQCQTCGQILPKEKGK